MLQIYGKLLSFVIYTVLSSVPRCAIKLASVLVILAHSLYGTSISINELCLHRSWKFSSSSFFCYALLNPCCSFVSLVYDILSLWMTLLAVHYGWRNGAKFTKFTFIHIQCSYWYSRIYLLTFNNWIYILEIYLFTFTCVFLIHDYICSHLRDVFIHIQRVISIHIHDRNHDLFNIFCAPPLRIGRCKTWTVDWGLG